MNVPCNRKCIGVVGVERMIIGGKEGGLIVDERNSV